MLSFENDYNVGAHPDVLKRLIETNEEPLTGYGCDPYTLSAIEKIKKAVGRPDAEVVFLVGGTQTNAVVISSILKPYEGVVAAMTGHVNTHEAGAIEHSGHKVMEIPEKDGKIDAETLRAFVGRFYKDDNHEHMVFPGAVYISQPTELGTLYKKAELDAIYAVCKEYDMRLYIDGARLAYALESREADMTLPELAERCDVFYIGGTKCGALIGEAVVFTHGNMPEHFVPIIKQQGALLAKGRVTGVQFDALFTDDLYFRIGREVIDRAEELKAVFREKGCRIYLESPTNQQFIIVPNSELATLKEKVVYSFWDVYDDEHTVIRFVTSWKTTKDDVAKLRDLL